MSLTNSLTNILFPVGVDGRRKVSPLIVIVVVLILFAPFYFKNDSRGSMKEPEEKIIKREDMIEKKQDIEAIKTKEKKDNFLDQLDALVPKKKYLKPERQKTAWQKQPSTQMEQKKRILSAPIIVYDATDNYQSEKVVPLGSTVKCVLIHNIITNNFGSPVICQVLEDFYFHDLLLPRGTRIYGTARAGFERDRVLVGFHTIVFQDGQEIKIKGIGLSRDGSAGLTGIVVSKQNKKRLIAMILNFLSGTALGLQETATNAVTGIDQVANDSRNSILEGVGKTFEQEAERTQKEIEKAEGYAVVPAGSEVIVYFEKSVDVDPL